MSGSTRRNLLASSLKTLTLGGAAILLPSESDAIEPPARIPGSRLKVGSCAYSYRKYLQSKTEPMSLYQFLDRCAALNMDGVELTSYYFPEPITLAEIHKITRHAYLLGLEVAGTAVGNTFCLPVGGARNANIAKVKQWIDYARDMGAPGLRVFAGDPPKGTEPTVGRKWVVECLQEVLPHAQEKGVMLSLENHHGVVADAEGVIEILDAIKSDWFGLKWDSGNFWTPNPYSDLAKTAKYAVTTHIKTEVAPNGKKQPADLEKILGILKSVHYRGYLLLEYEGAEEPLTAIPKAISELQKLTLT